MFTGLVEGTGTLVRMQRHGADARMVIKADFPMGPIVLGESIAVDGACLTVVDFQANVFTADVSTETLKRTTLGQKKPGARLNLERALRVGDRLGGHLVSGHVDGIGVVRDRYPEGRSWRLVFQVPRELIRYIIEKGSIAINGISLTVNGCGEDSFDVNIVPHTAEATTIDELTPGTEVNLETDMIGKYVEKMLQHLTTSRPQQNERPCSAIDMALLAKHGFID